MYDRKQTQSRKRRQENAVNNTERVFFYCFIHLAPSSLKDCVIAVFIRQLIAADN